MDDADESEKHHKDLIHLYHTSPLVEEKILHTMKLPCPTVVFLTVLACQEAHAFVPVSQPPSRDSALAAHKDAWSTAAATVAGWTLASQVAVASVPVVQPPPGMLLTEF